jgi:hypothetical protein
MNTDLFLVIKIEQISFDPFNQSNPRSDLIKKRTQILIENKLKWFGCTHSYIRFFSYFVDRWRFYATKSLCVLKYNSTTRPLSEKITWSARCFIKKTPRPVGFSRFSGAVGSGRL